jgi:hypothetical protein
MQRTQYSSDNDFISLASTYLNTDLETATIQRFIASNGTFNSVFFLSGDGTQMITNSLYSCFLLGNKFTIDIISQKIRWKPLKIKQNSVSLSIKDYKLSSD